MSELSAETERLVLRSPKEEDATLFHNFLVENRDFHKEWVPTRNENYYTHEKARQLIINSRASYVEGSSCLLFIFKKSKNELIGTISLTNIVYGPFLSAFLGYELTAKEWNKGYMTEAVKGMIKIAFQTLGLHRIEANVMPRNKPSVKLLSKSGFTEEGISRKYLKINGIWEDHLHFVKLNKELE